MTDRLIKATTALAVVAVAVVAALVSYQHILGLARSPRRARCDFAAGPLHRGRGLSGQRPQ
ncbi:hypothetical protein [Actinomadura sp. WMMA1423]|uniref:hypothetical protein n=1 Tax=Actinomadura sp. WMMA1423 TaxID=2591108 RepID=UPI0011467761|nr:hypothetical protein [Actinomadura sp. WMMA1423]